MKPLIPAALLALLVCATAAGAAEPQSPQAFMDGLYKRFEGPGAASSDWARGQASLAFDPTLAGLIRRYTAAADKAKDAGLDYVPFCGCNDDSGLHYAIKAGAPTGDRANAAVTVSSDQPKEQKPFVLNYDLVKTPAGWRVADIHSKQTPSLKAQVIANMQSEYHLKP